MNRLALVLAAAALAACATAPAKPPKALACQTSPQWITNNAQGRPSNAVFVCFGEEHQLLWNSRPLTLDELQKLTAPASAPAAADLDTRPWNRPECAYYRPESQKLFCHRVGKAAAK